MSMRIAVALAATIGAGILMSTAAEARPEMVGFRGDYSPGTIVVKTNERRLYLILDSRPRDALSGRRRPRRQAVGRHHPDRRQISQPGLVAAARKSSATSRACRT